jgi:hypothetical protein
MKTWKALSLAALMLLGACSSLRFEPTANWARDGGRLCAQSREPVYDWDRAAPRSCAQTFAEASSSGGW